MAVLLSLETSTSVCSAALHENGKILAGMELHIAQSASSKLAMMVDDLFRMCAINPNRIEAVAISAGPGSYTGLRIGVATAKGFCYGINVPLIAVNTLELMASQVCKLDSGDMLLCPMLDARRMEVYCLVADRALTILEKTEAKIIDALSFGKWLDKGVVLFFGNGSTKCKEIIKHPNAKFIEDVVPRASHLGELAFAKFVTRQFEDLSTFEPFYLKDFVAKKPKAE